MDTSVSNEGMGVIRGVVKLTTFHKLQPKFEPLSFICSENIGCPSILATSIHNAYFHLVLVCTFVLISNMFYLHYLSTLMTWFSVCLLIDRENVLQAL